MLLFDICTSKRCSAQNNNNKTTTEKHKIDDLDSAFSRQHWHWTGCIPNYPKVSVCKILSISILNHGFRIK